MKKYVVALLFVACAGIALAQSNRGTITGIVSDPTGGAVGGAKVSALNVETGIPYRTESTETGNYVVPQLPVGTYDLTVESAGFRRFVQRGIAVGIAQTLTLPVRLELGAVEQEVTVSAAASQLEASTSEVGAAVSREKVIDLPLAVSGGIRNPAQFIFLTPGVSGSIGNTNINGSQSRAKETLLDGSSLASPESGGTGGPYPNVEALSEFKLIRSNYTAEYGRAGMGFEIFTTKSGTNEFHGSLFEYFRNNVLDARGFFARTRPGNRQNEFGVAFGGPIWIPKVYNGRNRSFFHFVYSGFRFSQDVANQVVSMPNADFRRGDFTGLTDRNGNPMMIYDPATTASGAGGFTRTPFAGNRIPQSRFSGVSSRILPNLPNTFGAGVLNNFLTFGGNVIQQDQFTGKADHIFNEAHRLSVFIGSTEAPATNPLRLPVPFTNARTTYNQPRIGRVTHDWVLSPTKLNQFFVGATRTNGGGVIIGANEGWPEKIGLTGVNRGPGNVFPVVTFNDGFESWGEAGGGRSRGGQINNTVQIADHFPWNRGRHSLKFGVDFRWMQTNGAEWLWDQGRFNFSSFTTAMPTAAGRANSGSSFASFLLGEVDNSFRRIQEIYPSNRYGYLVTYIQDDWKVNSKLTLNIGLRYEIHRPRIAHRDDLGGFMPELSNPAAGGLLGAVGFLGSGHDRIGRRSFADTDYKNFGPRFGLAYQLNQKTVLRGGYGLFFAPGNAVTALRLSTGFSFGLSAQPTYASTDQSVTPAFNWDRGFPTNFQQPPFFLPEVANGANVNMIGRNDGRTPYIQNWTFSIQRELPEDILLEVSYTGNKGTRLGNNLITFNELDPRLLSLGTLLTRPVNSPAAIAAGIRPPFPGFSGSVAQALRPYPHFQNVDNDSNPNGNSTYHALQIWAQKRMSRGLTFTTAYTFSRSISDGDTQAGGGPAGQTYYNRRLEKSISTFDVPHILTFSYIYELPFGKGKPFLNSGGVAGALAGGWAITGIHQYQTGTPITLSANNTLPLFNGGRRPDAVSGAEKRRAFNDPATDLYINPAAFRTPQPFQFGTSARAYSDLRTFNVYNESVGLIKRTPIGEKLTLVFRAEFFNVFNRTVFSAPAANISNANFGRVAGQSNAPRQGQLALRLEF